MITLPKIVLIILLTIAVWIVFRWLNSGSTNLVRRRRQPAAQPQSPKSVEDLVACRLCGAYVAAGARGCGKIACPMPR